MGPNFQMVLLKNIYYYHFKHFKVYNCRLKGQVVVKRDLGQKSEIREFRPFWEVYTDPLVMLRAPFLSKILSIYLFLIFVKSHHFTVKKIPTPSLSPDKGLIFDKKGPFFH